MKKVYAFLAALALTAGFCNSAAAQGVVIKGGLSYSNFDLKNASSDITALIGEVRNYVGWHAGIGFQSGTAAGFSVQPELLINQKGTKIGDVNWRMNYLELPVNVQWGPDLVVCRPYIQVSPFIGYSIINKVSAKKNSVIAPLIQEFTKDANRFSYGVGVGGGIEIYKFQISAKYSWNFGQVVSWKDYASQLKSMRKGTANCLDVSIAFRF
ncbi:MAG: PorT family protein [Bacteroidales bacterium]|nr:PorT family protein [Bacteroidales bacterium]